MAKLSSLFSILRWALILTLLLLILFVVLPIVFPKHFKDHPIDSDRYLINCAVLVGLSAFGLLSICCYFYYFTIIFGISLIVYLIVELAWLHLGNIGIYLMMAGLSICSFTYCAAMRRLRHEAMYGP